MIRVGKRYGCRRDTSRDTWFTIIHKITVLNDSIGTLNYVGISDDGNIVTNFDFRGFDESMLVGGSWYELNLATECDPVWALARLIRIKKENTDAEELGVGRTIH